MDKNTELIYPEIYSNEFAVNIENLRFTLITQQAISYRNPEKSINAIGHFHTCYEVFLCEKGELCYCVDNCKITVKSGEMLVVSPEIYHHCESASDDSVQKCFRFNISSNGQKCNFDFYKTICKIVGKPSVVISVSKGLIESVCGISTKSEENEFYSVFKYAYSFLTELVELTDNVPSRCEGICADNFELRSHKIRVFINNNINKPITLKQISDYVGLSTRQTSRIINYKFGCNFKEYITKLRMEMAGELLLQNGCRVSEIAKSVGYLSERGFYTVFKNHFGCLPGEYRNKYASRSEK